MLAAAPVGLSAWLRMQDDVDAPEEELVDGDASLRVGHRFLVKDKKRLLVVEAADVDWIESASNYVRLHVGSNAYLMRGNLSDFAARLDADKFERIHRCTIVNMTRVASLAPAFNGDYILFLRDGIQLKLSRTYRKAFFSRQFLNGV